MSSHMGRVVIVWAVLAAAVVPAARAQWAVVDAPAIVQLVQEVATMEQQLQTARNQLTQAQQALQTTTGGRGMGSLLGGTSRNYLPSTMAQLDAAAQGGAGFTALASDVRNAVSTNAVLSPQQLATLSPGDQQQMIAGRQSAALQQALAQEALANASSRFSALQTLVAAISSAGDQKAILDLQARIGAELGMLQNEQTKLQILHQATDAQDAVNRQRQGEYVVAGHGQFSSRFQPMP